MGSGLVIFTALSAPVLNNFFFLRASRHCQHLDISLFAVRPISGSSLLDLFRCSSASLLPYPCVGGGDKEEDLVIEDASPEIILKEF